VQTMLKTIEQKDFYIVGITARTSNTKEMSGKGIIGSQWSRFFTEGIHDKIPNKADSNILAIYTDYESDRNGEYTFILSAKVLDTSDIPDGMEARKVPAGRYSVVTSAKGSVGDVVVQSWQKIWSMEDKSELGSKRMYKADYEVYDERSRDPQNSQVDIYVGVK
jgi:predicted transcriptional regulator YdeE